MRDDFIVTPDGTPASLAQPMGFSASNEGNKDDDEDGATTTTAVVGGSGFVGFGPKSANHVPGPVSVCDAITENFTLDVLRVDQNRLTAAVSVAQFL